MASAIMPRGTEPGLTKIEQDRPRTTSQKYSKEEKRSATSASAGEAVISTMVPKMPPSEENTRAAPSASSERPARVMRYASST